MPLIGETDKAWLRSHNVDVTINDSKQCGVIRINGKEYEVGLLLRTNPGSDKWTSGQIKKELMIEVASKIAVMLLKKDLLQQVSGKLAQQRIDSLGFENEITGTKITHEDKESSRNTRQDFSNLVDYLRGKQIPQDDDAVDNSLAMVPFSPPKIPKTEVSTSPATPNWIPSAVLEIGDEDEE